jgi:ATP-dependent helicase/nuclease subunit A
LGRAAGMPHLHPDEFEQHRLNNHPLSHPSKGRDKGEVVKSKESKPDTEQSHSNLAVLVGSICHRVLEKWDFHGISQGLQRAVESAVKWAINLEMTRGESFVQFQSEDLADAGEKIPPLCEGVGKGEVVNQRKMSFATLQIQDVEFIKAEVIRILSSFIGSEVYKELQGAQILGQEVPILLNWNGQIMRGAIDILYKIDDRIIIADYKTDHVKSDELPAKAAKYNYQRDVYIEAVKRCLQIENPEFKLIFLRMGKTVFL